MRVIEPLSLSQDGVDGSVAETFGTDRRRWYGFVGEYGVEWGEANWHRDIDGGPDYACDVTLPAVCAGSPDELRSDIAAALHRHAAKLGLD
jgi:hypothetical protein